MIQARTIDAGPVATRPMGDYNANTDYELLMEVLHDYDSWISLSNHNQGNTPVEGSIYWFRATSGGKAAYLASLRAVAAAEGAERVNISIAGMTVTLTNRTGDTESVNIGFEIYRTYSSVAEMNEDAANVPEGKFVMIATDDPTDEENARLYGRNGNAADSENPFSFLSDLDQASSHAWADWLENMKPLITADHQTALADHQTALSDHQQATQDHTLAGQAADNANGKALYAETQGDRAKGYNDHPWEIRSDGYIWVWDEATEQMKRTDKMIVGWGDFTPAQQQAIISAIAENIVFATVTECRTAMEELT